MELSTTAVQILDAAQELVQTRGFNAFSYRDLAERVGIRTASIHYHFPAKADLGRALMDRYRNGVLGALAEIDAQGGSAPEKLRGYAGILEGVLGCGDRFCLGGMLASDFATLPAEVQHEVSRFIEGNERWLERVLAEGRAAGTLGFEGSPAAVATALFSGLEGAMLVARSCGDPDRYRQSATWLLSAIARTS
jgi:TetR/AcrR family transcriptional regulator, transcriptional repressor for nem operon